MRTHIHRPEGRVAAGLVIFSLLALAGCAEPPRDHYQGYVEGDFVRTAAPFAGTLLQLNVQRGDSVKPGDPLFALEQANEQAARNEAVERLRRAKAQVANLQKGKRPDEIDAIRAKLTEAKAALRLSAAQLARDEKLFSGGAITREKLDESRTAQTRDQARVKQVQAELRTAEQGARPDEVAAAQAEVAAAQAAVDQAEWKLGQKSARSEVSGTVVDTFFTPGEWVNAGSPVVSILPPGNIKVRFFVPETILGEFKVGERLNLTCDGCPAPIPAKLSFISPQAEYTPPVIYSKDSRAKLVYLMEARPAPQDAARLHPGQPIEVRVAR